MENNNHNKENESLLQHNMYGVQDNQATAMIEITTHDVNADVNTEENEHKTSKNEKTPTETNVINTNQKEKVTIKNPYNIKNQ